MEVIFPSVFLETFRLIQLSFEVVFEKLGTALWSLLFLTGAWGAPSVTPSRQDLLLGYPSHCVPCSFFLSMLAITATSNFTTVSSALQKFRCMRFIACPFWIEIEINTILCKKKKNNLWCFCYVTVLPMSLPKFIAKEWLPKVYIGKLGLV